MQVADCSDDIVAVVGCASVTARDRLEYYACLALSPPHHHLLSTMVALGASIEERRRGDARHEAFGDDDDSCFPTWWPRVPVVPLESVVAQLHWEVSRLRYVLAVTQAQVTF